MRTTLRVSLLMVVSATILLSSAVGADAALTGPCEGFGTIRGTEYNARTLPDVVVVDREMSVPYRGIHTGAQEGTPRDYTGGGISVDAAFGIEFSIATWGPGTTAKTETSGTNELTLDEKIPGGVKVPVVGNHEDPAGDCSGTGVIMIEGAGSYDTILFLIFLILTLIFAVLTGMSGRGRPVMGAIGGLFFGLFLGIVLALKGFLIFGSLLMLLLPFIGLILGLILGVTAPFGRAGGGPSEPAAPSA